MTSRAETQRGQVLALLLLVLAGLAGAFMYVFDSGQLAVAKLRAVGAADAAAYGAALWQARTLNDEAYLNRAMVANEVAIAQSVSLRSWSAYVGRLLENASTAASVIPPLGAALETVREGWAVADRGLRTALPPLEAATSRWNVDVLSSAGEAAQRLSGPAAYAVASEIARANLPPDAGEPLLGMLEPANRLRWQAYTHRFGRQGDERLRFRAVVLDSRDSFSRRRTWTAGPSFLQLRKRGGTDLIGYDAWRGLDTLSLRESLLFAHDEAPLAWGAVEQRRGYVRGRGDHGGSYRDNPRASRYAEQSLDSRSGYMGLPAFRELEGREAGPRNNGPTPLRIEVALREPAAVIGTSDRVLGHPATQVPGESSRNFAPMFFRSGLRAMAAAQVEFARPVARADGHGELPSLFNPYWHARLVLPARSQRFVVDAAEGAVANDSYGLLP